MTFPRDAMTPMLRAFHEADGDAERAALLLRVCDAVLVKYREQFDRSCRRVGFEAGLAYIETRMAAYHRNRRPDGAPDEAPELAAMRRNFAAFAGVEPPREPLPDDVVRLVRAARALVLDSDIRVVSAEEKELARATSAFLSRVPLDGAPATMLADQEGGK